MKENNKFAKWFEENFEIAEVTISLDRVLECSYSSAVNMERKELIKLLKGLGYKYDKDMRGFGEKTDRNGKRVYVKGGFKGFRLVDDDTVDEVINTEE